MLQKLSAEQPSLPLPPPWVQHSAIGAIERRSSLVNMTGTEGRNDASQVARRNSVINTFRNDFRCGCGGRFGRARRPVAATREADARCAPSCSRRRAQKGDEHSWPSPSTSCLKPTSGSICSATLRRQGAAGQPHRVEQASRATVDRKSRTAGGLAVLLGANPHAARAAQPATLWARCPARQNTSWDRLLTRLRAAVSPLSSSATAPWKSSCRHKSR